MKVSMRGFGFYIISIIFVLLLVTYISDAMKSGGEKYGLKDYYFDLDAGKVKGVSIYPNEETPTGEVKVTLLSDTVRTFQATDVREVESAAVEKDRKSVV